MIGFRDRQQLSAHTLSVDRCVVVFDAEGVAWNPNPLQIAVLTLTPLRRQRFEPIERVVPPKRLRRFEATPPEPSATEAPPAVPEGDA